MEQSELKLGYEHLGITNIGSDKGKYDAILSIDELLYKANKYRDRAKTTITIAIAFFFIVFVGASFSNMFISSNSQIGMNTASLMASLPFLVPFVIIPLVLVSIYSSNKYKNLMAQFKDSFMLDFYENSFDRLVRYEPKAGFSYSWMNNMRFGFPSTRISKVSGSDFVHLVDNGVEFQTADCEITYTTSSGKHGRTTHTLFKGRVFLSAHMRNLTSPLVVTNFSKGVVNYPSKELVSTESDLFDKKWRVYSSQPVEALTVITPQVMEKLMAIERPSTFQFMPDGTLGVVSWFDDMFEFDGVNSLTGAKKHAEREMQTLKEITGSLLAFSDRDYANRMELEEVEVEAIPIEPVENANNKRRIVLSTS